MKISQIAQICHDANKSYCQSIGDQSQKGWNNAPDWQKESAINGVMYHLQNPDSKPEDSHNNWLLEKESLGWKYGSVKDVDKKEHPCFIPYDELPLSQKKKDLLFISIVNCFRDLIEPCEPFNKQEQIETEFHLLAVDEGIIKKPIIKAENEAAARATFLTECPNATIHECKKLD